MTQSYVPNSADAVPVQQDQFQQPAANDDPNGSRPRSVVGRLHLSDNLPRSFPGDKYKDPEGYAAFRVATAGKRRQRIRLRRPSAQQIASTLNPTDDELNLHEVELAAARKAYKAIPASPIIKPILTPEDIERKAAEAKEKLEERQKAAVLRKEHRINDLTAQIAECGAQISDLRHQVGSDPTKAAPLTRKQQKLAALRIDLENIINPAAKLEREITDLTRQVGAQTAKVKECAKLVGGEEKAKAEAHLNRLEHKLRKKLGEKERAEGQPITSISQQPIVPVVKKTKAMRLDEKAQKAEAAVIGARERANEALKNRSDAARLLIKKAIELGHKAKEYRDDATKEAQREIKRASKAEKIAKRTAKNNPTEKLPATEALSGAQVASSPELPSSFDDLQMPQKTPIARAIVEGFSSAIRTSIPPIPAHTAIIKQRRTRANREPSTPMRTSADRRWEEQILERDGWYHPSADSLGPQR